MILETNKIKKKLIKLMKYRKVQKNIKATTQKKLKQDLYS